MDKSKQTETSEECKDGVDRISNLPDDALRLILSCIQTTEEVIRTSVLSRRWRYVWNLVPSIDIDISRGSKSIKEIGKNRFREFVYWVLLNKPQHLESFRLWCADYYTMSTVKRWIHAAVMRKVKLLDLKFRPIEKNPKIVEFPLCLVNWDSLEVLRLCLIGRSLRLPKSTRFPALRVLELNDINMYDIEARANDLVESVLESCPLLEDLSLINCTSSSLSILSPKLKKLRIDTRLEYELYLGWKNTVSLKISCPQLELFRLTGFVIFGYQFESLFSLKKVVIHSRVLFDCELSPTLDFFDGISHVESLSINLHCITHHYITQLYESRYGDPVVICLPNLKVLEVRVDDLHLLIPFLKCFPDLESLHLIIPKNVYRLRKWNKQNLAAPATMSILTRHLKKVDFLEFDEEKPKLVLARALLEHANELEEMVFIWSDEAKFHERSMETMKKLSKIQKASSTVKLITLINPSQAESYY